MAQKQSSTPEKTIMRVRVRLDQRTVITIRDPTKLDFWKERYPEAKIIS